MSEPVKRYDCTNGGASFCQGCYTMSESDLGDYVEFADYDAMAQRCRELEADAEQVGAVALNKNAECIALRADVADLKARLLEAERGAEELVRVRAENRELRQDATRIAWLADQARMIYGHKDQASYQLSELPELIQSSREACRPDDLRRAIDEAMEASRDES